MTKSMSPTEERSPDARKINLAQKRRLLKRLRKISQLRQEVVGAEIPKREKSRAVAFARNRVRDCDNRFMRELRILAGQGRLQGFEELMRLASQLQDARDSLGPIEQESIDLDQEWEWQASELAEAEQDFYEKFHEEFHEDFQEAAGLPSGSLSSASSDYQASPQFANSYLGDEFENPKEDARYGDLPTSESIAHECSTPPLLETMSLQKTGQIDTSSVDAAAASSSVPPYDQALEEIVLSSGNNIHQEEETRASSASTDDETNCHGSEISASEELHYVPEDSITGDSLTAMEQISVWLIQTSIFSRWDAYLVKWRFMFEDKQLVPTWVVLVIMLAQSKSLPRKYDRCGAGDFLSSITEVDIQPKPLLRHSLAKLPEEQEGSATYEPASQDNAIASAIGDGSSYNLGSTATEEKSPVPVDHPEILSDNTKTDSLIDQIVTQPQYIRTSDDVQKVRNGQKNPQLVENNATTFDDPEQNTNIPHSLGADVNQDKTMKGAGTDDQVHLQLPIALPNHKVQYNSRTISRPEITSNQDKRLFDSSIVSPNAVDNVSVSSPVPRDGSLLVNQNKCQQKPRRASDPAITHKSLQIFRRGLTYPLRMSLRRARFSQIRERFTSHGQSKSGFSHNEKTR